MKLRNIFSLTFLCLFLIAAGRPSDIIELRISPASGSWTIPVGKEAVFNIDLTDSNIPLDNQEISYEISEDMMDPLIKGSGTTRKGRLVVKGGTMKVPGFLRCKATYLRDGHKYTALGTIGFDPEKIQPTVQYPSDFTQFWEKKLEEARKCELKPGLNRLEEKCTPDVDVYQVSYSVGTARHRFYAMLAIPKGEGKLPAVVQYPGAGIYNIDAPVWLAEKGVIAMSVGIHAIPNDLDPEIYRDLDAGALNGYPTFNMHSRDSYYYRSVIQGAVRAIDFIETLPRFNGCVATYGGSQGGYLSIAVASLHPAVKYLVAEFPAMSDLSGYAYGRAGGWPHMVRSKANRAPEILSVLSYFDTVNFARNITVPGYYGFGFNDLTCSPTTTYSVYNVVTAPKTLMVAPLAGHYPLSEQSSARVDLMLEFLKACSTME